MSAIAGILLFDEKHSDSAEISKLITAMKSYGPDGDTHWYEGSIALGHCMLRTTPESKAEVQPLSNADGSLVLIWDGRLDNRAELLQLLDLDAQDNREIPDPELVLQSYQVWREACNERFIGDFAYAVWDKSRNQIYCARDHMGARPLYYFQTDDMFAFASDEEALLELLKGPHSLEPQKVAVLLVSNFQVKDPKLSWIKGISVLPPAHWMKISRSAKVESCCYWQLQPDAEAVYSSDEDCIAEFLKVFGEAVRCRLRSHEDVALMMSGGLDSAGIAAMSYRLKSETTNQLHTYSAISDDIDECVETQSILALRKALKLRSHTLSVPSMTGVLGIDDLMETVWSKPHPVNNSIVLPSMMFKAANANGHRVMLHGMGGDYTMYLHPRYIADFLKRGQLRRAWRECRYSAQNSTLLMGQSTFKLLLTNAWTAFIPLSVKKAIRKLRSFVGTKQNSEEMDPTLVSTAFSEEIAAVRDSQQKMEYSTPESLSIQQKHISAMKTPNGHDRGLNGYNRSAARYGLELRDPWSDKRVVEFWLRLPLEFKVRNGWSKYLVRAGFQSELPEVVKKRSDKQHIGWKLSQRLMAESLEQISKTLAKNEQLLEGFVDQEEFRKLHVEYQRSLGEEEWGIVFELQTLALLLKRITC